MQQVAINATVRSASASRDAVRQQPDMEVLGVAKTRPNFEAETAIKGVPALRGNRRARGTVRRGRPPDRGPGRGTRRRGRRRRRRNALGNRAPEQELYEEHDTPALYQGAVDAELTDVSFNARSNFENAVDADHVRVVSCNTTGLSRVIALRGGPTASKVRATLVRRGGDPASPTAGRSTTSSRTR